MHKTLPLALLALAALAACNRNAPTDPMPAVAATAAAPATVAAPAAPATAAQRGVAESAAPGEHTAFDAKAFAGTFADSGTQVTFTSDGTYTMTVHAESADAKLESTGTWTLEADGRHVRLDPNDKAEQDRVFEVVSNDELHAETGGQMLRRNGGR